MHPHLVEKVKELPECPYLTGASLSLEVYPFDDIPGSPIPLNISAQVLKPFLPFTNSQALQVQIDPFAASSSLPNVVLLKLFDRRFIERALIPGPWTSAGETELQKKVADCLSQGRVLKPASSVFENDHGGKYVAVKPQAWMDAESWGVRLDVSWSDWEGWEREVIAYGNMLRSMDKEAGIYVHLSALQGIRIPKLYGIVYCVLRGGVPGEDIITRTPGLMLEYVDGPTLRDLHVGQNISEEEAEILSQKVLSAVRELRKFRVVHVDIRRANIVVRDVDRTPFLIDFGLAEEHTNATGETWRTIVSGLREVYTTRTLLEQQGLHLASPFVLPPSADRNGFRVLNKSIESRDDKWRQKYVERVEVDGPASEMRVDENGVEYEWEFSRWKFKPGVNTHGYEVSEISD